MPNSRLYREFHVERLTDGLKRGVRRSAVPLTAWYDSLGFSTRNLRARKVGGWRAFGTPILSPEFQDYHTQGVAITHNTIPLAGRTLVTVTGTDMTEFWTWAGTWEYRLLGDPDSYWTEVVFAAVSSILLTTLYPGEQEFVNEPRRYELRRKDPVGSSAQVCPVQTISSFFRSISEEQLFFHTGRDVYRHNPVDPSAPDRVTPKESTGTASLSGTTVTGTGTTWVTDGVLEDHLFKFDADPDTAWTRIASVNSETEVDLADTYRGAGTSGNYTIIRCYAAGAITVDAARRIFWSTSTYRGGQVLYVATNGVDRIQKNTGSGDMTDLAGLDAIDEGSPVDVSSAKVAIPYWESLVIGNLQENGVDAPNAVRWSTPLEPEVFKPFKRLTLEGDDAIVNAAVVAGNLVWFNERSVHNMVPIGPPFDFRTSRRVTGIGCIAPGSVQVIREQAAVFLGQDDFYLYDTTREQKLGTDVRNIIFDNLNDEYRNMIASTVLQDLGLYLCSFPATKEGDLWNWRTLAYDFEDGKWSAPYEGFMALGRFFQQTTIPINADDRIINTVDDPINARASAGRPVSLAGSRAGEVYSIFDGLAQDTAPFEAWFTTGLSQLEYRGMKRIGYVVVHGDGTGANLELEVAQSMNGADVSWSDPFPFTMEPGSSIEREKIVPVNLSTNYVGFRIRSREVSRVEIDSISVFWRPRSR